MMGGGEQVSDTVAPGELVDELDAPVGEVA